MRYNTRRRHSALGYMSSLEFERLHETVPVDVDRPVDALRAPRNPVGGEPALRAGPTTLTGNAHLPDVMT